MGALMINRSPRARSGPHAHYDSEVARLDVAGDLFTATYGDSGKSAWSLRNQTQLDNMEVGSPAAHLADAIYDATRGCCQTKWGSGSPTGGSEPHTQRMYITFAEQNPKEGGALDLWFQWEYFFYPVGGIFDGDWLSLVADNPTVRTTKGPRLIHLSSAPGDDDRRFDVQERWSLSDGTAVSASTLRAYGTNPLDGQDPLRDASNNHDFQPGGDNQFNIADRPMDSAGHPDNGFATFKEKWIQKTIHTDANDLDNLRIRMWMADEDTDPVLVVADLVSSSLGFDMNECTMTGGTGQEWGYDTFDWNWTSSQIVDSDKLYGIGVRNLIVAKDEILRTKPIA